MNLDEHRKKFDAFVEAWSGSWNGLDLAWNCWLGGAVTAGEEPKSLLRNMVNAQHAGPITDDMYAAWDAARKYLEQEAT